MTRYSILFAIGVLSIFSAMFIYAKYARPSDQDISFSITDSEDVYRIKAVYPKTKTKRVQQYLEKQLGPYTDMAFENVRIDGTIALDGRVAIYLLLKPGKLKIELNKKKNPSAAYRDFRSMADGLKAVILAD